jgi:CRISPR/Cas system CSM-associated protein Csm2 small subunit
MGSTAAEREFKRQTKAWKEKRAQSMQPVAPVVQEPMIDGLPSDQQVQAEPEQSAAVPEEPVEEQAQLRILEPVDRETIEEALTSTEGGPSQQMERLRTAIEASKQELESVREINRELDQLRSTLETEIGALRQSLEERDAVIEELIKRMEQEDAAAAALARAQTDAESDTRTTTPVTDEAEVKAGAIESSLAGTDSLTQDTADDEGSSFWVTGLLTVVILVMSLVAFFLWWSLYRGRSSKEESVLYNRVELPEVAITKESYDGLYRKLEQQEIEERERLEAEKSSQQPPEDQTDVLLTDEFFDEFEEQSSDSVETSEITTEAKPDVSAILTEADVYLIYRQYAKAESLVQECLQSHPQEPRLMAKLLEIYASQKAKAQFVAYLDEVADPLQRAAPDIWQRVKDLGSALVPEHPLFSLGGSTLVEDEEFDSGLSLQDPEIASIDIPAIDEQLQDRDDVGAPDSLDLELDLDDDDRGPGR